ncbi:hypothetical protein ACLKA7_007758 [Drosophila subpalustris]
MNGFKSRGPTDHGKLTRIVEFLFPPQQSNQVRSVITHDYERTTEIVPVTVQEVLNLAKSTAVKKAAGPDGIPNKALKLAMTERPQLFANTYTKCLTEGTFSSRWKKQNLRPKICKQKAAVQRGKIINALRCIGVGSGNQ